MPPWEAAGVKQPSSLPCVGLVEPIRFRPRFHYELLVCGLAGHELIGIDARELSPDDALVARTMDGARWHRCLRCDSWLPVDAPVPPPPAPPPASRRDRPAAARQAAARQDRAAAHRHQP